MTLFYGNDVPWPVACHVPTVLRLNMPPEHLNPSRTTSRPQEASMTTYTKPTVVTSVTLERGNEKNMTIADLKRLVAEVERVGGNDESVVALAHDSRSWTVALTCAMPEEPAEEEPTSGDLLDEWAKASEKRKAEITTLLGL